MCWLLAAPASTNRRQLWPLARAGPECKWPARGWGLHRPAPQPVLTGLQLGSRTRCLWSPLPHLSFLFCKVGVTVTPISPQAAASKVQGVRLSNRTAVAPCPAIPSSGVSGAPSRHWGRSSEDNFTRSVGRCLGIPGTGPAPCPARGSLWGVGQHLPSRCPRCLLLGKRDNSRVYIPHRTVQTTSDLIHSPAPGTEQGSTKVTVTMATAVHPETIHGAACARACARVRVCVRVRVRVCVCVCVANPLCVHRYIVFPCVITPT